tara:strand:- start:3810 stop:4907 length:1098 start_codon:yes stop_codon:yes gene_type:complete
VFFSGKKWLYKAVSITYLKGYASSYIDDFIYFPANKVATGDHQKWLVSKKYNKKSLPQFIKKTNANLETVAFIIIKNDSIQYEEYWNGYSSNSISNSFSMAKSWVSTLIGVAIKEGDIKSVDQKVCDFLPEFCIDKNEKITIEHLLTMSAGLNWKEDYRNPIGQTAEAYYGCNLKNLVLTLRAIEEPGKYFKYHSASTQLLSFVLEAATGKTISEYASEKLWIPMGAKNPALWSLDGENGDEKGFCCINSNARDFARLGKLYLNQGNWNGRTILDSSYISKATTAAKIIDKTGKENINYGYQFWITNYKNLHVYYAKGLWGQYVICIPKKNIIIVRLGKNYGPVLKDGHHEDLYLFIDAALEMFP